MRRTALLPTLSLVAAGAVLLTATSAPAPAAAASGGGERLALQTVSTRPGFVTGGDVLVRVDGVSSVRGLRVTAGGRDVTRAFTADAGGLSVSGLVDGLRLGRTDLVATAGRDARACASSTTRSRDRSSAGRTRPPTPAPQAPGGRSPASPSGRRSTRTARSGPASTTCTAPRPGRSPPCPTRPYAPPTFATATTSTGEKVPYIVRVETGTINRAIYETAVTARSAVPPTPARCSAVRAGTGAWCTASAGAVRGGLVTSRAATPSAYMNDAYS